MPINPLFAVLGVALIAGLGIAGATLAVQSNNIGPVSGSCCSAGAGKQATPISTNKAMGGCCSNGGVDGGTGCCGKASSGGSSLNSTCDSDSNGKCDSFDGGACKAPCDTDGDGKCEGACASGGSCH